MKKLPLSVRLVLGFLLVAVMPMAGLAWFYLTTFDRTLTHTVLQNVSTIADKKTDQINNFVEERLDDARSQARSAVVHEALQSLVQASGGPNVADRRALDQRFRQRLADLADPHLYHHLLLIDLDGNVVFSVRREADLGTNLLRGPYQMTLLAQAYRQAMTSLHTDLSPFAPYAPSGDEVSAFLVTPVLAQGRAIGALALQLSLDTLMPVVLDRTGLGQSGETVLAQRVGQEVLYTAPLSRVDGAPYSYRIPLVNSAEPMQQALAGQHGQGLARDYVGIEVAAAWRYLPALRWGMVVKMDSAEALAPARQAVRLTWLAFVVFVMLSGGMALLLARRFLQTEGVLAAQEARFRAMLGSMTDGVAVLQPSDVVGDFDFVDFNARGERIIGMNRQEVLQRPISRVLPGVEGSGILAALRDTQSTGQTHTLESVNYQDARLNLWIEVDTVRLPANELMLVVQDISERKAAQARIEHLARHDTLTGLFNRYTLETRLDQALLSARRSDEKLAVLFIDLDRFKAINDAMGHHVGDLLLIEVARRLLASVRESDIVARQGGDEFVVVLSSLEGVADVASVANKILETLALPYELPQGVQHTSPSIGIALFPQDGEDVDSLMKNADTAMYAAKEQGRNNIQYFNAAMTARAGDRLELERDLRRALDEQQFELYYQPQVRTRDASVCGVEALIRWHHPTRGLVSPALFIPLAEETGLILPLGRWVIEQACRQRALWRQQGLEHLRVAVNLSAHQLREPALVAQVQAAMQANQLCGEDLELEVTESVAMSDPQAAIEQLQALRALGLSLAIDDFGTGYSSLAYLKRLPIQVLKLDREFVRDIETDPNDAAISAATLALAHSLGLQVVAEGVETPAQRDFLAAHQCDVLQGYLFGKPEPADTLGPRLKSWVSTG